MIFMVAFFLSMRVFNEGNPGWKHIITSDGRGYYAWLPALILDNDPTFSKTVAREGKFLGYHHYRPGYLVPRNDRMINKYFSGEALLLLPFFLTGTLFTFMTGNSPDGFSFFFQFFIGAGALFYLFLGLYYLKRILEYLAVRDSAIIMTLLLVLFGTNLFYYNLWQQTMSHLFSFFAINGFIWHTIRAGNVWKRETALPAGLFLGLVCLIRPVNVVVVLLIPFLLQDSELLRSVPGRIRKNLHAALWFTGGFIALVSIQALLWWWHTGHFFIWSYHSEGFSFRKGLFIYTPLIAVALFGLIPLFRKSIPAFFSAVIFLCTTTFVISSWWNWYYGDGFGLRAFIDFYGFFAILLALIFQSIRSKNLTILLILLISPLVLLNLVQTWQYTHYVIQPNSMNAAKYRHVFMRTDSAVINCLGGNQEMAGFLINTERPVMDCRNDFEKPLQEHWNPNTLIATGGAFSGRHAGLVDSLHPYSPGIAVKAVDFCPAGSSCFISGELMVRDSLPGAGNKALVVLSIDSIRQGESWWQGFKLNDIPLTEKTGWRKISFSLMLPEIADPERILKVYIWNTGKKPLLIDDFTIRFFGEGQPRRPTHPLPGR